MSVFRFIDRLPLTLVVLLFKLAESQSLFTCPPIPLPLPLQPPSTSPPPYLNQLSRDILLMIHT